MRWTERRPEGGRPGSRARKTTAAVLLGAALIPMGVLGCVGYTTQRDRLTDDVLDRLEAVAEIQARRIEESLTWARRSVALIASRTALRERFEDLQAGDSEAVEGLRMIMADAALSIEVVTEISLVRPDGVIAVSTTGSREGSMALAPVQAAARGRVSTPGFAVPTDGSRVFTGAPLMLDGALIGAISVGFDGSFLATTAGDYTGLGETGETLIGELLPSGDARYLAPPRFADAPLSRPVPIAGPGSAIALALAGQERRITNTTDYRDAAVLAVTRHLEDPGWGVVVKMDRAEALEPVDQFRNLAVIAAAVIAVVAALVAWRLSRHLTTLNRRLERRVEERTTELADANEQLARTVDRLEQFAYVASHDLKEPLRSIAGFSDLLARRLGDDLDTQSGQFLGFITEGVDRMDALITDLLAFSRADRAELELEPVDLEEVLHEVVGNLSSAAVDAEVQVDELPTVVGDRQLLHQLFQNLLSNALKFRRNDVTHRVEVRARAENGHWAITVADNGIGIEPQHHDRIYRVFQRLHTRDEFPGTGIGLAICQTVAHRHGGTITAAGGIDGGTAFTVTLPDATVEGDPPGSVTR